MGKNRSPEPVFELPAHFTEWSGREGGPVGRPLARLWPPFGRARAALRAAPFSKGGPSGGPFSVRAALTLRVAALWAALRLWWQPAPKLRAAPRSAGPRPSGRPILEGGRPLFSGGPPELGQRAAPFGGWAAPVAAGRPAHHLRPIRPLTGHRFLQVALPKRKLSERVTSRGNKSSPVC